MPTVTSYDGTDIAFEQTGTGPTLIMVSGATQYRAVDQEHRTMFEVLSPHFKVVQYDRRGRGGSTDTLPYAVQREIDDIEALIDHAGSPALLFGHSSGGALALRAAVALGRKVAGLAIYEVPFNDDPQARDRARAYKQDLRKALSAGDMTGALKTFMRFVGMPGEQVTGMQQSTAWEPIEQVAQTLAYDAAVMGDQDAIPVELAAQVSTPTLVMDGEQSFPFMHPTAVKLAQLIPDAQHRTLKGQTHDVKAEVLAPELVEFFLGDLAP